VIHTRKVGRNKKIVTALELEEKVSGRDLGQIPPRLLPDLGFGLDTSELFRRRRGS